MSLWYSILGYVNIKIEGLSIEKFLNIMGQAEMKIWDVKRVSRTTLTASIKRSDFFKLQQIIRSQNLSLQVLQKHGTAKHIRFLKMRNILLLLLPLAVILIYAYTSCIWVIEINGVSNMEAEKITASLKNCGVWIGMPRGQVDQKEYQRVILKENTELSWVGVNVVGVKLEVKAVKEEPSENIVDKSTPSNIVANKDGIIESIIAYDGVAKVEVGQTFRKGDVLISGVMEHTTAAPRYVCARGIVKAKTYYDSTININEMQAKNRTGNSKTIKYVEIGNIQSPTGDTTIDYKYYDCEIEKVTVTDSFFIPLYFVKKEVYELEITDTLGANADSVRSQAEALAYEKALSLVPKEGAVVIGSLTNYNTNEKGELLITVSIQAIETVGETVKIENIPDATASPTP